MESHFYHHEVSLTCKMALKNENVSMTLLIALETSIVGFSNLFIEIVFSTE